MNEVGNVLLSVKEKFRKQVRYAKQLSDSARSKFNQKARLSGDFRSIRQKTDQELLEKARAMGRVRVSREALKASSELSAKQVEVDRLEAQLRRIKSTDTSEDASKQGKVSQALLVAKTGLNSLKEQIRLKEVLDYYNEKWDALTKRWARLKQKNNKSHADELRELIAEGDPILAHGENSAALQKICERYEILLSLRKNDEDYLQIFIDHDRNWFKVKDAYKAGDISREVMRELWNYREKIIKGEILPDLVRRFNFEWVAVGSADLTSDIDVGIMSHGHDSRNKLVEDFKIMEVFNREFLARFGQEAGIFFDVNLYASAPQITLIDEVLGGEEKKTMKKMEIKGQDVAALMKLCRYMTPSEYMENMEATLKPWQDELEKRDTEAPRKRELEALISITRTQYEEADALYQLSLKRTLLSSKEFIEAKLKSAPLSGEDLPDELELKKEELALILKVIKKIESGDAAPETIRITITNATKALEEYEDIFMSANNKIYTQSIERTRKLEQRVLELQELQEGLEMKKMEMASDLSTFGHELVVLKQKLQAGLLPNPGIIETTERKTKITRQHLADINGRLEKNRTVVSGLLARIPTLFANSILFANEAYLSQGPMKHIVEATQGVKFQIAQGKVEDISVMDWEKMDKREQKEAIERTTTERRRQISPYACLQSFNEQQGDLLKDLNHYRGKPAGYAFSRASKYMSRLLDAIILLMDKVEGITRTALGLPNEAHRLKHVLDTHILPVRKGETPPDVQMMKITDFEERDAAVNEFVVTVMSREFGTEDQAALRALFISVGRKVNQIARETLTKQTDREGEWAYFASFSEIDKDLAES